MCSAYQFKAAEIADDFAKILKQRNPYLFRQEWLPAVDGLKLVDALDLRRISEAMQVLKRRGLVRYRPGYRKWQYCHHKPGPAT